MNIVSRAVQLEQEYELIDNQRAMAVAMFDPRSQQLQMQLKGIVDRQRYEAAMAANVLENVAIGTLRKPSTLDLRTALKMDDGRNVLEHVVTHVERNRADYPMVACDLRLIIDNFDPQKGVHRRPNMEGWPMHLHAHYRTEQRILHTQIKDAIQAAGAATDYIDCTIPHGAATQLRIRSDESDDDGVHLFMVMCAPPSTSKPPLVPLPAAPALLSVSAGV